MREFVYHQQSFLINENQELSFEYEIDEKAKTIEKILPLIYEDLYQQVRCKKLSNQGIEELSRVMMFIFNKETNFNEILNCSRETQIQAFNLFTECFYNKINNSNELPEDVFQYIEDVITFSEEVLDFVPSNQKNDIAFGAKGLVKSELYKHHNYQIYHK